MNIPFLFVVGQLVIALGAYMLAKALPWTTAVGAWLIAEGVITVVIALLVAHREADAEPWHGGAADPPP